MGEEHAGPPTGVPGPTVRGLPGATYSVTVEDHVMVAHSLPHPAFGPAQRTHGATYDVAATFWRDGLDGTGVVLDLGAAASALRAVLADLDYSDLDEHPAFTGVLSTTEVVARHVAAQLLAAPALAEHVPALTRLDVVLRENPRASAGVSVDLTARPARPEPAAGDPGAP